MRMNQLPMPASGARTARFGRRTPPSSQGWSITAERLERAVALPYEPQACEREKVVDLVEVVAEGGESRGEPAGRDDGAPVAELVPNAPDDPVDLAREA